MTGEGEIRTTRVPNGIRVVTERTPGARSLAIGFWVAVGSRDEPAELAGASHFLEHLLFKGTATRSARDIAVAVDAVGGEMNAYTAREHTAYEVRLPADQLELGLDLLSDVVWAPAFRGPEVEAERQVILEEILMEEDDPEDKVHALLVDAVFPDHGLGRETLGTRATIEAMGRDAIRAFHGRWYRPANVVVAAAGAVDHDGLVEGVLRRSAGVEGGEAPVRRPPVAPPVALDVLHRRTEQAHLAVGLRGLPARDDDRWALAVLHQVLGGGMSSRLVQDIREERGLAYSVYSPPSGYADAGALSIYAGTAPRHAHEVLGLIDAALDRLVGEGITDEELDVARGYLAGSTLLGLEDPGACSGRIGRSLLVHGRVAPVEELVARYRDVCHDDVRRVISRVLARGTRTVAVVGPFRRRDVAARVA